MKTISAKQVALALYAAGLSMLLSACGGGGGNSAPPIYHPFSKINGAICYDVKNPVPGCTYNTNDGSRVNVSQSADYGKGGSYSSPKTTENMMYVQFDILGNAYIYDPTYSTVIPVEIKAADELPGFKEYGLGTVWFGTDGGSFSYRHDVVGGTYWLDSNWVLYNAMSGEASYGKAINNLTGGGVASMNFSENAVADGATAQEKAAKTLIGLGIEKKKAATIANILLTDFGGQTYSRGYAAVSSVDNMYKAAFGVDGKAAQKALADVIAKKEVTKEAAQTLAAVTDHLGTKSTKNTVKALSYLYSDALEQYAGSADLEWAADAVDKIK